MNKFLLRLALPTLLKISERALSDALQEHVKVPNDQRKLLNKLGFDEQRILDIDARVQGRIIGQVLFAIEKAVK